MVGKLSSLGRGGFTLIELLVSVAIMGIMASVVLVNYPELNSRLTTDLIAHDVALSIRQAQQFALGVRQQSALGTNPIDTISYGIHFDPTVSKSTYFMFADTVPAGNPAGNFKYDAGELKLGTLSFIGGMEIKRMCIQTPAAADDTQFANCVGGNILLAGPTNLMSASSPGPLDVVFRRPNPDTSMNGKDFSKPGAFSEAAVVIGAARGTFTKEIHVYQSGQISVN